MTCKLASELFLQGFLPECRSKFVLDKSKTIIIQRIIVLAFIYFNINREVHQENPFNFLVKNSSFAYFQRGVKTFSIGN